MIFVLRPIPVADRCFLCELLYWVALRRLPLAQGHPYEPADEYRFSDLCELDTTRFIFEQPVSYAECELASLPPTPLYQAILEKTPTGDPLELTAKANLALHSPIRFPNSPIILL